MLVASSPSARSTLAARQVGAAMRELRRMQDTVRGELDQVLHPDLTPAAVDEHVSTEETDHAALAPGPASAGAD